MFSKLKLAFLAFVFVALASLAFFGRPANALVTDPNRITPERTCEFSQSVCYSRVTINYNDPRITAGVWYLTLPKNSYILQIDAQVVTAFNAGTTNPITVGATQASANEIVASGITSGSTGIYHLTTAAGLGNVITNNSTYQTALNGAVPVWVKYAPTGTAATTGQAIIIITFIKNNDQ